MKKSPPDLPLRLLLLCGMLWLLICSGCNNDSAENLSDIKPADVVSEAPNLELSNLQRLVSSEEIILALGSKLATLNRSIKNLELPFGKSKTLFEPQVALNDLLGIQETKKIKSYLSEETWDIGDDKKVTTVKLWRPFLENIKYFEMAKFYFVSASLDPKSNELQSNIGFVSRARNTDGQLVSATAKIKATWKVDSANYGNSKILEWKTKEFKCLLSKSRLFEETTSKVVLDNQLIEELANSRQEDLTRRLILGESIKAPADDIYQALFFEVTLEHPAVSVVDFDNDGLDDFFLTRRYLPSLMFRNEGNGTFVEVGESIGLRIANDCVCSLFADYDNDGDQDVFIGRSRHRAIFMRNENGVYVERPQLITDTDLPYMVSSICAADYDQNGLLDVYFSTYSPIEGSHMQMLTRGVRWPNIFLNVVEQVELSQRIDKSTQYVDVVGPPNLLLNNTGGKFSISDVQSSVESWRMSFQSSWCDFDQDGDPDLYVCNDFSPDDLYRNDGAGGFNRVNDEIGLDKLGFGMGVSWQDHNNDGHFDLYVSNMYSKAGTRITKQIEGIDPRLQQMARGNYLYEFDGIQFDLVSLDGPNKAVSKTGWSWGGRMIDLDNDGYHDIAVPNGYYSAPKEVEIKVDL